MQLVKYRGWLAIFPSMIPGLPGQILQQRPEESRFWKDQLDQLDLVYLQQTLTHTDVICRRMAANQFAGRHYEVFSAEALDHLQQLSNDEDPECRIAACETLLMRQSTTQNAWDRLTEDWDGKDDKQRLRAVQAIGHLGPCACKIASRLVATLDCDDAELVRAIVQSLPMIGGNPDIVVRALLKLSGRTPHSRWRSEIEDAIILIGRNAAPAIARCWFEGVDGHCSAGLFQMIDCIGWLPQELSGEVLSQLGAESLTQQSIVFRLFALDDRVRALYWFDDLRPIIREGLSHSIDQIRKVAIDALNVSLKIDDTEKLTMLATVINDPSLVIRSSLKSILGNLSNSESKIVSNRAIELQTELRISEGDLDVVTGESKNSRETTEMMDTVPSTTVTAPDDLTKDTTKPVEEHLRLLREDVFESSFHATTLLQLFPSDPVVIESVIERLCDSYLYDLKTRQLYGNPSFDFWRNAWPGQLKIVERAYDLSPKMACQTLERVILPDQIHESEPSPASIINTCRVLHRKNYPRDPLVKAAIATLQMGNIDSVWIRERNSDGGLERICASFEFLDLLGEAAAPGVLEVVEWVDHGYDVYEKCALQVLGSIGPKAIAAIPRILEALDRNDNSSDDRDSYSFKMCIEIRERAALALVKILELDQSLLFGFKKILRNDYVRHRLIGALKATEMPKMEQIVTKYCQRYEAS